MYLPFNGEAQPSPKTWTHCKSILVISTLGRVSASFKKSSFLSSATISSDTRSFTALGMIPCKNDENTYYV